MDADDLNWKDGMYVNPWRREDMPLEQDESEMDMNFNWTGITVFEIPLLTENVEPETTDLTARAPKPLSHPNEPSEQQRQVHNLTHLPFRSWWPHCVRGKAKVTAKCEIHWQTASSSGRFLFCHYW